MKHKYSYIKSSEFIENMNFEYFETYSFQRGKKFKHQKNRTHAIINKKGQLHFSAEKISRIEKTDSKSK